MDKIKKIAIFIIIVALTIGLQVSFYVSLFLLQEKYTYIGILYIIVILIMYFPLPIAGRVCKSVSNIVFGMFGILGIILGIFLNPVCFTGLLSYIYIFVYADILYEGSIN